MQTFFQNKAKGLKKENYAAGPIGDPNHSFLEGEDQESENPPPSESSAARIEGADDDGEYVRPTNEYVLNVAFFSFLGFMAVQAIFAIIANSESMLADSEAMSVDALTYLFNLCAERIKKQPYSEYELSLSKPVRDRRRTMKRLYLEVVPPLISVSTLIAVTVVVMKDSYRTLFGDPNGDFDEPEEVDVTIMLIFSALNLLLDVVNVTCFARADQAFGLQSITGFESQPSASFVNMSSRGNDVEVQLRATEGTPLVAGGEAESPPEDTFYGINLNMCSAWTHICADTMRSVAVLVAALIASVFQGVDNESADATAAVIVSFIIILSLLPLLHGLFLTIREIFVLSRTPISGA